MKKFTLIASILICLSTFADTYWPLNQSRYPIQRGTYLGRGYVVGTNDAAVIGSGAIGGKTINRTAMVLDASNAFQIGAGTNETDNTLQFLGNVVPVVFTDSAPTNTLLSDYYAPSAGCVLVGKLLAEDEIWISNSIGTNWHQIGQVYAEVANGSITAEKLDPTIAGLGITFDGTDISANYATETFPGTIRLPNINQTVWTSPVSYNVTLETTIQALPNLAVTITPRYLNSKIRITATINGGHETSDRTIRLMLYEGDNIVSGATGDAEGVAQRAFATLSGSYGDSIIPNASLDYFDSPGVLTTLNYNIRFSARPGNVFFNRNDRNSSADVDTRVISTITVEEIYQ